MAVDDCIPAVAKAAGRELDDAALREILDEVQANMRRKVAAGADLFNASRDAGVELAERARLKAMIERRSIAKRIIADQGLEARIAASDNHFSSVVRETTTGVEGSSNDMARSVDADQRGLMGRILGPMIHDLRKEGLLKPLQRRAIEFDRDVARELWRLEDPSSGAPTGNRAAMKTAEILHTAQETARALQNDAGAWISKLDHYITRQSHDMWKIRGDGTREGPNSAFSKWAQFILPRLDERTFAHLKSEADIPEFLLDVWNALSTGVHDSMSSTRMGGFTGPGNLAKRVSQERKLHFKDADAWVDYNTEFGRGGVLDSIQSGLTHGARDAALMRMFGPNPRAKFDSWRESLKVRARDLGLHEEVDALSNKWDENIFDVLTGAANVPAGKGTLAKIGATARAMEQMSKLGAATLSSIPDLAVNAAMLRHNGIGLFESYARQVAELLPGGAARREVADQLGAGIDSLIGDVMHRFSGVDQPLGKMSKAVELFHKLNGLTYWTESLKTTGGLMLTNNLARNAEKSFSALDARLQVTLRRYGIDAAEWDTIRTANQVAADGRNYILPEAVRELEAPNAESLGDRLQAYVLDQVREGMTEPTAGIRAQATFGTQSGTGFGELARLMMQFKTYTLTYMNRTMGRELHRGRARGETGFFTGTDPGGIAALITGTTLLGYAAMTLKEIAKGRSPREPEKASDYAHLVGAAFMQGGGFGIYGDFLFGEANRMGGGLAETLAGPTISTMSDGIKLLQSLREGSVALVGGEVVKGHPAAQAVKFAANNAPFINLWGVRTAMDYLVLYSLQETLNPGYLHRYEQQVEKKNAQHFYLSPSSSHLETFGR